MRNKEKRIKEYNEIVGVIDGLDVETLDELGFFTAPASTKYHGAY